MIYDIPFIKGEARRWTPGSRQYDEGALSPAAAALQSGDDAAHQETSSDVINETFVLPPSLTQRHPAVWGVS